MLVASLVFAVSFSLVLRYFASLAKRNLYPPGPPSYPLIGNILDVSPLGAWIKFTKYKEKYGPGLSFHVYSR
jgi:hypothetical protein